MTSLSVGEQFNELVKVDLSQKQMMTDQTDSNVKLTDESAKSQDFFQDNNLLGKNTQQRKLNLETFFRILRTSVQIRKISTTRIIFPMFICL